MKFAAKMRFAIIEKKIDIKKWKHKKPSREDLAKYLDAIEEPQNPDYIKKIVDFLDVDQDWLMGTNNVPLRYGLYHGSKEKISDEEWAEIEKHAKYLEEQNKKNNES